MQPYASLSRSGQVRRLQRLAQAALRAYPVEEARLIPLRHEENTTFRVKAPDANRYVLCIQRPVKHSEAEIRGELIWLAALGRDTELAVPQPLATLAGDRLTVAAVDGVPEPRVCVLFRWRDGRFLDDGLPTQHLARVGSFMARLHEHASHFAPPAGFVRGQVVRLGDGWRAQDDPLGDEVITLFTKSDIGGEFVFSGPVSRG